MPVRRLHIKFDDYLTDHGILFGGDCSIVHDRLDRDVKKFGGFHRELDSHRTIEGAREWLRKWCHLAYQDTLTDYLRVALGHLVLDDVSSNFVFGSDDELTKICVQELCSIGFWEMLLQGGLTIVIAVGWRNGRFKKPH